MGLKSGSPKHMFSFPLAVVLVTATACQWLMGTPEGSQTSTEIAMFTLRIAAATEFADRTGDSSFGGSRALCYRSPKVAGPRDATRSTATPQRGSQPATAQMRTTHEHTRRVAC